MLALLCATGSVEWVDDEKLMDAVTKMVKGKVTGLPFPAHAEIVLEGYVSPDKRVVEGPFGEWTGHYAGGAKPYTVLDIKQPLTIEAVSPNGPVAHKELAPATMKACAPVTG